MHDRVRFISRFTVALGAGLAFFIAPTASAHVDTISASCDRGLVINLVIYDPAGPNTIVAYIDGSQVVATTFGDSFVTTVPFGDLFVAHTYRVVVTAWDDPQGVSGWSFDTGIRNILVCAETTTTVASTTVSPTTTVVATTVPSTTMAAVEPPASSVPPSSVAVASVLPGSTVVVAQAAPSTEPGTTPLVASQAPPGDLPVTGPASLGLVGLGLIVGGGGLLIMTIARRSAHH